MLKTIFKAWFLMAVVITGLSGLLYATIQQDLRQSANDPQVQMAEDIAAKLEVGQPFADVVPVEKVDIGKSLAPYIMVFDTAGRLLASSGELNGHIPGIPSGVFDAVKQRGEDRITWQPQSGVRSAIVLTKFQGANPGFVLVGRSLRETEARVDDITRLIALGWLGLLIVSLLATTLLFFRRSTPLSIEK